MSLVLDNLNKGHIFTFLSEAEARAKKGVYIDRSRLAVLRKLQELDDLIQGYIGDDASLIVDSPSVVSMVTEVLTKDSDDLTRGLASRRRFALALMSATSKEDEAVKLVPEHAILLYHLNKNTEYEDFFKGVALAILQKTLTVEFNAIYKEATRDMIKPIYGESAMRFGWRKYPHFLSQMMLDFTLPKGYKGYVVGSSSLAHQSFLVDDSSQFEKAKAFLETATSGILVKELPLEVEYRLMSYLLGYRPVKGLFNGIRVDRLNELLDRFVSYDNGKEVRINICNVHNIVNYFIKPRMIETMGALYKVVQESIDSMGFAKEDVFIYFMTMDSLGIAVREDLAESQVFNPLLQSMVEPITPFSLDEDYLLSGKWL